MDWSKAKTILILGFIALNLFLGLQLVGSNPTAPGTSEVTFETAAAYLESRGWPVEATEPMRPDAVADLEFIPYAPDFETVAQAFFGEDTDYIVSRQEGEVPSATYILGSNQLILNGYGVVFFYGDGSLHTAAADVLSAAAGELLPGLEQTHPGSFEQRRDGLRILGTYVTLNQHKDGVQGYTQQLVSVRQEMAARACISPVKALLKATETLETGGAAPCAVEALELCYWAPQLSVQSGRMVPVWQVSYQNGQTVLVNAATGEVEAS